EKPLEYASTVSSGFESCPENVHDELDSSAKVNICLMEQATQTEVKDSVNEIIDSITTPIFIQSQPEFENEPITSKPQNYQVCVTIIESRHFQASNDNFVINLEVGGIKKSTSVKEAKENLIFNEYFVFDFTTFATVLFEKNLIITVVHRPKSLLRHDRLIGNFRLDVATIFAQTDHQFCHKWLPVIDQDHKVSGYILCDLAVNSQGAPIKRTVDTIKDEEENIESNLLILNGQPFTRRRQVKYIVNVYRGEGFPMTRSSLLRTMKNTVSGGRSAVSPYVKVSFDGNVGKTSVCKHSLSPVWNEKIIFYELFPPLCQRIKIDVCNEAISGAEQVIATHYLDISQISNDDKEDGYLPTFGPSYIYLYGGSKRTDLENLIYQGRLLLSLETELCEEVERKEEMKDGEQEEEANRFFSSPVSVEEASPITNMSAIAKEDEFMFFGAILESNLINKKFINKKIRYELSIGHMGEMHTDSLFEESFTDSASMAQQSLMDKETWSSAGAAIDEEHEINDDKCTASISQASTFSQQTERSDITPPMKAISTDKHYLHLPIGDTKPCLYLRGFFPDLRRRLYHSNVIIKIADELQTGLADVEVLEYLDRPDVYRRLRGVLEELVVGCNRFSAMVLSTRQGGRNKLDIERCKYREKVFDKISKDVLAQIQSVNRDNYHHCIRLAYQWLHQIRNLAEEPQHSLPDIIIWMIADKKKVAYARLKAKDFIFSLVDEDKGKYCSKSHNLLLRPPKNTSSVYNRLQVYAWFGPVKYKCYFPEGLIKGFESSDELSNADVIEVSPPRSLKYLVSHTCQLRAHLYQGALSSFSSGLLNPFAKVIYDGNCVVTQTIEETLGPMWDVMLVQKEVTLYGEKQDIIRNPPFVTIELYDKDKSNNVKLIGRCLSKCFVRFDDMEYVAPKLEWFVLWHDGEPTAELLAAVEIIQISENDDLMSYPALLPEPIVSNKSANYDIYPIPPNIRPQLSKYKLEVIFWGLRDLKKVHFMNIDKPRVDVELAGHTLSSTELQNFKENPNFTNPVKSIDIELPVNDIYAPPLTIRVVHKTMGNLSLAGTHIIPFSSKLIYKSTSSEEKIKEIGIDPRKYVFNESDLHSWQSEENQIDWWVRYKASLRKNKIHDHKYSSDLIPNGLEPATRDLPDYMLFKIFDTELEKSLEFGSTSEWGLCSFPLYREKKKSFENEDSDLVVGTFKGSIQLYKYPFTEEGIQMEEAIEPASVIVRVYIIEAENLVGKSLQHKVNPYLNFILGGKRASDKENYVSNQQNPTIGKCFEFEATFPQDSVLTIQVNGYDRFGVDYLIGETKIDLENRFYSRHRCLCGLPKVYSTTGANKWRDTLLPSQILQKLCNDLKFNGPEFATDLIKVGNREFIFTTDEEKPTSNPLNQEEMCLAVLNNWDSGFGYHLLPEHIETRALYNPRKPGLQQGSIRLWVDIFSKAIENTIPPPVDISPKKLQCYELRVTVLGTNHVHLRDITFFTGEKTGDLYVKGWLIGSSDTQITDTTRTHTGDALFHWRFIFPFDYYVKEHKIIVSEKSHHGKETKIEPHLNLQVWDSHNLSADKLLGALCIDLCNIRVAATTKQCALQPASDNQPSVSLFKQRNIEGWWPLSIEKNEETLLRGKINLKLELLTKEEALENPAGFGRNAPQPLKKPK
ncbi:otoferlin-like protein, partial [Dinothrombium tinctorium]